MTASLFITTLLPASWAVGNAPLIRSENETSRSRDRSFIFVNQKPSEPNHRGSDPAADAVSGESAGKESIESLAAADGWDRLFRIAEWLPQASTDDVERLFLALADSRDFSEAADDDISKRFPDLDDERLLRQVVLLRWTELDPREALAGARRRGHELAAFEAWAKHDPDAAWAEAIESPDHLVRRDVLLSIAAADPDRAAPLMPTDLDRWHDRGLIDALALGTARRDLAAGATRAIGLRSRSWARIIRIFTRSDPDSALGWARGLPNQASRSDALSVVMSQWARLRPEATALLIQSMPASRTKMRLFAEHAARLALDDPASVRAWIDSASTPALRNLALTATAETVAPHHPAAALEWLRLRDRLAGLPPSVIVELPGGGRAELALCGSSHEDYAQAALETLARWFPLTADSVAQSDPLRRDQNPSIPANGLKALTRPGTMMPWPRNQPVYEMFSHFPVVPADLDWWMALVNKQPHTQPRSVPTRVGAAPTLSASTAAPRQEWIDEVTRAGPPSAQVAVAMQLARSVTPAQFPALAATAFPLSIHAAGPVLERAVLFRWLQHDAMAALGWAWDNDPDHFSEIVGEWAILDPIAAADWFESGSVPTAAPGVAAAVARGLARVNRDRAFAVLASWDAVDPLHAWILMAEINHELLQSYPGVRGGAELVEARRWDEEVRDALKAIAAISPPWLIMNADRLSEPMRGIARQAATAAWAPLDIDQAVAWVRSQPDRKALFPALFWSNVTTAEKMGFLSRLSVTEYELAVPPMAWKWSIGDAWEALPHLKLGGAYPLRLRLIKDLSNGYQLNLDPAQAVWKLDRVAPDLMGLWAPALLGAWSSSDPAAARQWVSSKFQEPMRSVYLTKIDRIERQLNADDDPKSRPSFTASNEISTEEVEWRTRLKTDWSRIHSLTPGQRRALMTIALNPGFAFNRAYYDRPQDDETDQITRTLQREFPADVAPWVRTRPPDDDDTISRASEIAAAWASEDPMAAANWAAGLEDGSSARYWALRNAVNEWKRLDVQSATAWIRAHSDPVIQELAPQPPKTETRK